MSKIRNVKGPVIPTPDRWEAAPGPVIVGDFVHNGIDGTNGRVVVGVITKVGRAGRGRMNNRRIIPVYTPLTEPEIEDVEGFDVHEIGTCESDEATLGEQYVSNGKTGDRFAILGISDGHIRIMWPERTSRDTASCVRWVATGRAGRIDWGGKRPHRVPLKLRAPSELQSADAVEA